MRDWVWDWTGPELDNLDHPRILISIAHNCYCSIYWWKTCFLAKFGPSKDGKWSFLKKIPKMISETIDSVNKIYFLTKIHCWMSGNILWNLILAQPGCVFILRPEIFLQCHLDFHIALSDKKYFGSAICSASNRLLK